MNIVGDLGVANNLQDGGIEKVLLHAGVGAIGGAIMGGGRGALGGALGAGLSELALPFTSDFAWQKNPDTGEFLLDQNGNRIPGQLQNISQLLGGIGSLLAGDGSMAGATSALNGFEYNRMLHVNEVQWIRDNAARFARATGITQEEAERRLAVAAFDLVQAGADLAGGVTARDQVAIRFLLDGRPRELLVDASGNKAFYFSATPEQRANTAFFQEYQNDAAVARFYSTNGLVIPTSTQISTALATEGERWNAVMRRTATQLAIATGAAIGIAISVETAAGIVASCAGVPICITTQVSLLAQEIGAAVLGNPVPAAGVGVAGGASLEVSGANAVARGASYEEGLRAMRNTGTPLEDRTVYITFNGQNVRIIADDVAMIGGRQTAIEGKYVEEWASSISNPLSSIGSQPWAREAQERLVAQAAKYAENFPGGAIYHTNSPEFAAYYSRIFANAGIRNIRFEITPATRR